PRGHRGAVTQERLPRRREGPVSANARLSQGGVERRGARRTRASRRTSRDTEPRGIYRQVIPIGETRSALIRDTTVVGRRFAFIVYGGFCPDCTVTVSRVDSSRNLRRQNATRYIDAPLGFRLMVRAAALAGPPFGLDSIDATRTGSSQSGWLTTTSTVN